MNENMKNSKPKKNDNLPSKESLRKAVKIMTISRIILLAVGILLWFIAFNFFNNTIKEEVPIKYKRFSTSLSAGTYCSVRLTEDDELVSSISSSDSYDKYNYYLIKLYFTDELFYIMISDDSEVKESDFFKNDLVFYGTVESPPKYKSSNLNHILHREQIEALQEHPIVYLYSTEPGTETITKKDEMLDVLLGISFGCFGIVFVSEILKRAIIKYGFLE